MITSRTKKQLIAFVFITLIGVSFVGARYAKLNRLFYSTTYSVNTQLDQSGGIFSGAEVTYRGVHIGQVSKLKLTKNGVDAVLSIDRGNDKIPSDTFALVGNKSAVGEQYVDLEPRTDKGPYLKDGSTIDTPDTGVPVSTTEILTNLDNLVESVPQGDLRVAVSELGAAFAGTGPSLAKIIDTSDSFIQTANANYDVTTALLRDTNTVLQTQADKTSAIRSFSQNLALFTDTVAAKDADVRSLIDNGSATANELRTFLEQNRVNLGSLISNLLTTNSITVKHLKGIRQVLVILPYVVAGGFTVAKRGPDGKADAQFGLILTTDPANCIKGYEATDRRSPQNLGDRPMRTDVGCTAGPNVNPRGAEKSPNNRTGVGYRPPVATYDQSTGQLTWTKPGAPTIAYDGGAAQLFGQDSWKWMLLQPSAPNQE